jgi:quercetin dioxygenase-like cupin family protein
MITVSALISGGNLEQLPNHLKLAKENGVTKTEIAEVITQLAFCCGWPKALSAFNRAKEVFAEEVPAQFSTIFPRGAFIESNNFMGDAYPHILSAPESTVATTVANVTFAPGARNNRHFREIGQVLLVTGGKGYYQEEEQPARQLTTGDIVNIPAYVRHWHGAAPDSWLTHIAVTQGKPTWFEPLTDKEYLAATKYK